MTGMAELPLSIGIVLAGLIGLIVGSFINVVAYRLPKMMARRWLADSTEFLLDAPAAEADRAQLGTALQPYLSPSKDGQLNLCFPASHCTACKAPIKPWHNIPVLGWLLLRGRCASCKTAISPAYPIVELFCGILTAICVAAFGVTALSLAAIGLCWCLLTLSLIDLREMLLPDCITLPLAWAGLLFGVGSLQSRVYGAVLGYLVLWTIGQVFGRLRGKDAMGQGDMKLLAALGAWLGWAALLPVVVHASIAAVVVIALLVACGKGAARYPFGPYLSAAGIFVLLAPHFGVPVFGAF